MATARKTTAKAKSAAKPAKVGKPDVKVFIAEYKIDRNGRRAAIAAGYSAASADSTASRLLKTAKVKAELATPDKPLTPWQVWSSKPDAIDELCSHVVSGGHMNGFCKEHGFPYTTMLDWMTVDPGRSEMYARAREDRSDMLADEIVAISDEAKNDTYVDENGNTRTDTEVVQRSKLRIDARKWVAAKLKPRVYGEKLTLDGKVDHSKISDEELLATLARFGIAAKIGPTEGATDA